MLPRNHLSLIVAVLVSSLFSVSLAARTSKHADTVFRNGSIYALDRKSSKYEAMAVKDGVISFLGTNNRVEKHIGPNTNVFDLEGRMAMPGLIDAHMHLLSGGASLVQCNLNDQSLGLDPVLKHIQGCLDAETNKTDADWLEVVNLDWGYLSDVTGGVTKKQLDTLNTKRPVVVVATDRHSIWINSAALQASDITESTPNPPGGVVDHLPGSQEPSGVLHDGAVILLKGPAPPTPDEQLEYAEAALKLLREQGVTTFQDAATDNATGSTFTALRDKDRLSARGFFDWRLNTPNSTADVKNLVESAKDAARTWNDARKMGPKPSLKLHAVKLFVDGVIMYPGNTGALIEPYFAPSDNDSVWAPDPSEHIAPYWPSDILTATLTEVILAGLDAQLHVDGDMAVRTALDAVETFRKNHGDGYDYRLGFAHNELTDPKDWPRFHQLKIDPIMSFQWSQASSVWIPNTLKAMGPVRSNYLEAWGDIAKFGTRIIYGSDWPIDPLDEWLAIKAGITRSGDPTNPHSPAAMGPPYDGPVLPGLSLSREQAIRAITIEAARFLRANKKIGSLEVGKLADVIILQANYFEVPDDEIARQKALLTMVGGEVVYIADGVDFKNGVMAKFPNDDDLGKKLSKNTVGGIQGRSLSSEGHEAVRRLSVRSACDHGTATAHLHRHK